MMWALAICLLSDIFSFSSLPLASAVLPNLLSGHLCLHLPLPRLLFLQLSTWLFLCLFKFLLKPLPSGSPDLPKNVTSQPHITCPTVLYNLFIAFITIWYIYVLIICLLPLESKFQEDNDFVYPLIDPHFLLQHVADPCDLYSLTANILVSWWQPS